MKIYDFTSGEREFGRVVFALTLNSKRMTERIVIGKEDEVRLLLNGADGNVYYDKARPLGSLLFNFENDKHNDWRYQILTLQESYKLQYAFGSKRWDKAAPVSEFLTAKYNSGEPSAMFAAIRTWDEYLNLYNKRQAAVILSDRLCMLYKPFEVYGEYRPWQKEAANALANALPDGESQAEVWYPISKRPFETVVNSFSLLPIISYYLNMIEEWRLVFQKCKVCNIDFLAKNRHYEVCSEKCRKVQAVKAKSDYTEWAKNDKPEQDYKVAYNYWYNQLRKLKKRQPDNSDAIDVFNTVYKVFCKNALERKNSVRRGNDAEEKAFADWLFRQQSEADRLLHELTQKRHDI